MKIVINNQYGGFSLSLKAQKLYSKLKGLDLFFYTNITDDESYIRLDSEEVQDYCILYTSKKDLGEKTTKYPNSDFYDKDIPRNDPFLIQIIEQLGEEESSGDCASLKIVEIPDDVEWQIQEYDGNEWIAEKHRTWN